MYCHYYYSCTYIHTCLLPVDLDLPVDLLTVLVAMLLCIPLPADMPEIDWYAYVENWRFSKYLMWLLAVLKEVFSWPIEVWTLRRCMHVCVPTVFQLVLLERLAGWLAGCTVITSIASSKITNTNTLPSLNSGTHSSRREYNLQFTMTWPYNNCPRHTRSHTSAITAITDLPPPLSQLLAADVVVRVLKTPPYCIAFPDSAAKKQWLGLKDTGTFFWSGAARTFIM